VSFEKILSSLKVLRGRQQFVIHFISIAILVLVLSLLLRFFLAFLSVSLKATMVIAFMLFKFLAGVVAYVSILALSAAPLVLCIAVLYWLVSLKGKHG
jgi:hypothetical protein